MVDRHAVDGRSHQLVDVFLHGERVHDVELPGQPSQHAGFDLCRVSHNDDVALGCQNRAPQLAATLEVLEVHLVAARPAVRVRARVVQQDRQTHPVLAGFEEADRAGFADRRLDPDASLGQSDHLLVAVLQEFLEVDIRLGEGVGWPARRRTDLHRWVGPRTTQQLGELLVGHEILDTRAAAQKRCSLAADFLLQLLLHARDVDAQDGVAEHLLSHVDQLQLLVRDVVEELPEDLVGVLHVVDAIRAKRTLFLVGQLLLALGVSQRVTLHLASKSMGLGDGVEVVAHVVTMRRAGHGQGVEIHRRADVVDVRADEPVEGCVVCQHGALGPVDLPQCQWDVLAGVPERLAIADFDAHAVGVEAVVADVLRGVDLPRQGVVLVVVGLEVDRDDLVFLAADLDVAVFK